MKAAITDADKLVRKRSGRWTLVARHPLVKLFFRVGGDYEFLARHPDALETSTGGNEVDWELDDDVVVLSHQLVTGPPCRISRRALTEATARLATHRHVVGPSTRRTGKKTLPLAKAHKGTTVDSVSRRSAKTSRSTGRVATR